jgi:peptidoglycan LD-endopeptidase LytH
MRSIIALVATLAVLLPTAAVPVAHAGSAATTPTAPATDATTDAAAQQAAKEIADARDRANAAADALFSAESKLDVLDVEQSQLSAEIAKLEAQIAQLKANIEAVAINRFTRSGSQSIPLLTGFAQAADRAQMDVLVGVVNETSAEDFDVFGALSRQLADKQAELATSQRSAQQARDELERRTSEAMAQIQALKRVEADRLKDAAIRKALAAEQASRRSKLEAAAASAAEQQRANDPINQAINETTVPLVTTPDDEDDIDAPVTVPKSVSGTAGGLTGRGGAGGRPGASPGVLGGDGWLCPVQGTGVFFSDTWGAPRSGGRVHQGVDMIGERGLPLVAVVDGVVTARTNTLGGRAVSLNGVDGTRYYYAHLEDWAATGVVTRGTIIGYLGQTGNAQFSVPHLHFEIHPEGGAAVNPYPTIAAFC